MSWRALLNGGYVNLGRSVWGVVFPAGMLAVATSGFTLLGGSGAEYKRT